MHVRSPGDPDEPPANGEQPPVEPPTLPLRYRVPTRVVAVKFTLAAAFALTALVANGRLPVILALLAAVGMAIYGVRDLVARERLRVESDGLTVVHGFAGHGQVGWDQVEVIRVDERLRLGLRTQLLEVDAGDWIGLFSRQELGAEPEAVVAAIDAVRPGSPGRS